MGIPYMNIYILYTNTEILLNYIMLTNLYLRKRYSHVFCKEIDECLTVHLVSNCSAVITVRRIGHVLNILDEQQLNFVAMFNISVVLIQWSLNGAKKGKPSVFSWRLFCKAILLMMSSFTPLLNGDRVFQLLHL